MKYKSLRQYYYFDMFCMHDITFDMFLPTCMITFDMFLPTCMILLLICPAYMYDITFDMFLPTCMILVLICSSLHA